MAGIRPWLANYGVTVSLQETSEYLNNLSGGVKRGGAYDGVTQFGLVVDTEKAFGLSGGTFNASGLQIHGSSLSQRNLLTLQSVSGIEADDTTRLWELWYQQSLPGGKMDVKVGQQSLDQEFMVSQYANLFMNATFGWSVLPSIDLPAGGPAYPLSSLGVRVRTRISDALTVLAGVFDGNPAGSDGGDPQKQNAHGTNFNLHNGALFIGEVQYAINQPPATRSDAQPAGYPEHTNWASGTTRNDLRTSGSTTPACRSRIQRARASRRATRAITVSTPLPTRWSGDRERESEIAWRVCKNHGRAGRP